MAVPIAGDVGHQAVLEPLRDVVAVGTAYLRTDADAVHHLAEQQACNTFADLGFKVGVVTVEIQDDL